MIHWLKRRYPGRCKITISGKALDYDKLEQAGDAVVPAGAEIGVYEMDVKHT